MSIGGRVKFWTYLVEGIHMDESPRILVVGAGVNGSAVAAGLSAGGVDVTVLTRGNRIDELRQDGIVIENPFNHKRTITRVPVIDTLNPEDSFSYVLVIVRKNHALDLLPTLAKNRSPNIVFMGNNISGPGAFVKALGKERVMMGSVFAGGKRDGSLIRAMVFKSVASPFGEIDGMMTPRLHKLAEIIRQGGFKVELSRNIVDTQMTHGVGVVPLALLVIKHGVDLHRFARTTEDLKLYVSARREGHQAMCLLGHQVLPTSDATLVKIPAFLQVLGLRLLLNSKFGEVGLAWHVSKAPDEMHQLANELKELVDRAGLPAPALRKILG
jgi:2-dehydropantoate 2-reductase